MKRINLKSVAAVVVLVGTFTAFIYYFGTHPVVREQLGQTSPGVLAGLLALYLGTVVALALVFNATQRLCKLRLEAGETILLTAYSSVVNFFGPLQSGPAFRAVYLKKKYDLNLKNYTVATLVYYCFYGGFSGLFLLSGLLGWWLIALVIVGLVVAYFVGTSQRIAPRLQALDLRSWYYLAGATLLQVSLVGIIYYIELRSINPAIEFSQAIVYTGAANLALFVSLTPGAIGFRESFLLFSQQLHHVSTETIVAANILDRSMYIILMLILALFIFATHARKQLGVESKN